MSGPYCRDGCTVYALQDSGDWRVPLVNRWTAHVQAAPGTPQHEVEAIATQFAASPLLLAACKALLACHERSTCIHEETYRAGTNWEICHQCGARWADDEGGKPEWQDPPEWEAARAAIAAAEGERR